jgi:hypothetical protein
MSTKAAEGSAAHRLLRGHGNSRASGGEVIVPGWSGRADTLEERDAGVIRGAAAVRILIAGGWKAWELLRRFFRR